MRDAQKHAQPQSLYGEPIGGVDLQANVDSINGTWEQLVFCAWLQRGQPTSTGKTENVGLGPDVLVKQTEPNGFSIVSPASDLTGIALVLSAMLEALAVSMGLPRRTFRLQDTQALTGAVIVADRAELSEDRRKRTHVASQWERGIHRIAGLVADALSPGEIDPSIRVVYLEEPVPQTVPEVLQSVGFALDRGLMDEYTAAQLLWPGLPAPERTAQVDKGLEAQSRRVEQQVQIAGHADQPTEDQPTDESEDGPEDIGSASGADSGDPAG